MRTIIQMVQLTRLDCAIASAGIMRMALAQAIHHARHRSVFQKPLAEQPMMQAVLADMALEVEGGTALVMRLCRSFDLAAGDPREAARARLLTRGGEVPGVQDRAGAWSTRRWSASAATAMSRRACCRGSIARRRSMRSGRAPATSCASTCCARSRTTARPRARCWERSPPNAPGCREASEAARSIATVLSSPQAEGSARVAVGDLALLAAAAALRQSAPPEVAELFARTRLARRQGTLLGTSELGSEPARRLLERALPPA